MADTAFVLIVIFEFNLRQVKLENCRKNSDYNKHFFQYSKIKKVVFSNKYSVEVLSINPETLESELIKLDDFPREVSSNGLYAISKNHITKLDTKKQLKNGMRILRIGLNTKLKKTALLYITMRIRTIA